MLEQQNTTQRQWYARIWAETNLAVGKGQNPPEDFLAAELYYIMHHISVE